MEINQVFWTKIEDILFLIETQTKNLERLTKKESETTEKLHQIISDSYMNHPNNSQVRKEGRWQNYSSLADRLDKFAKTYGTGKDQQVQATENLLKSIEVLKQFQDAILLVK